MLSGRKRKSFFNKKGSLQDIFFIGIVLLVFSVSILISFVMVSNFNDKIQDLEIVQDSPVVGAASAQILTNFTGSLDNGFLLLTIGLSIGALILASLVRIHPIFIVFFIIALVFVIFFSAIVSNIYQAMAVHPQLSEFAGQLTFVTLIMNFLPLFIGIIGTLLMVVSYKLWINAQQ